MWRLCRPLGPFQSLEYAAGQPLEIRIARKIAAGPILTNSEHIIPTDPDQLCAEADRRSAAGRKAGLEANR